MSLARAILGATAAMFAARSLQAPAPSASLVAALATPRVRRLAAEEWKRAFEELSRALEVAVEGAPLGAAAALLGRSGPAAVEAAVAAGMQRESAAGLAALLALGDGLGDGDDLCALRRRVLAALLGREGVREVACRLYLRGPLAAARALAKADARALLECGWEGEAEELPVAAAAVAAAMRAFDARSSLASAFRWAIWAAVDDVAGPPPPAAVDGWEPSAVEAEALAALEQPAGEQHRSVLAALELHEQAGPGLAPLHANFCRFSAAGESTADRWGVGGGIERVFATCSIKRRFQNGAANEALRLVCGGAASGSTEWENVLRHACVGIGSRESLHLTVGEALGHVQCALLYAHPRHRAVGCAEKALHDEMRRIVIKTGRGRCEVGAGYSRTGPYSWGRLTLPLRKCCAAAHALLLAAFEGGQELPSIAQARASLFESAPDAAPLWLEAGGEQLLTTSEGLDLLRRSLLREAPPADAPWWGRWIVDELDRRVRYRSVYYNRLVEISNASRDVQPTGVTAVSRISFSSLRELGFFVAPSCVAANHAASVVVLSPGRTGTIAVIDALQRRVDSKAPARVHVSSR